MPSYHDVDEFATALQWWANRCVANWSASRWSDRCSMGCSRLPAISTWHAAAPVVAENHAVMVEGIATRLIPITAMSVRSYVRSWIRDELGPEPRSPTASAKTPNAAAGPRTCPPARNASPGRWRPGSAAAAQGRIRQRRRRAVAAMLAIPAAGRLAAWAATMQVDRLTGTAGDAPRWDSTASAQAAGSRPRSVAALLLLAALDALPDRGLMAPHRRWRAIRIPPYPAQGHDDDLPSMIA